MVGKKNRKDYFISMAESNDPIRTIIHLDMDAFYASVEMLDDPELRGKPVVVGGLSSRSVVSAASYEARKFGIHSAMPTLTAYKLCPEAIFLPGRMGRYREISGQIMTIFHRFTPLVEPISLDEAFLDVSGSAKLFGSGVEIAATIRALIHSETGLTASAGVASCKLLAKIASDLKKPDGMTVVEPGRERQFLAELPISKLWGVGRTTLKSLKMLSVRTIGDLAALPLDILTARYGNKHGSHMYYASRGIDDRPVVPGREAKSIGHEDTFSKDIRDLPTLRKELLSLATKVGERLRRHGKEAKTISIKIKFNDFVTKSRSLTLAETTSNTMEIFQHGWELVQKTEAGRKPVRLLGISISNLSNTGEAAQMALFSNNIKKEKGKELTKAIDKLNLKFGGVISPGSLIKKKKR